MSNNIQDLSCKTVTDLKRLLKQASDSDPESLAALARHLVK